MLVLVLLLLLPAVVAAGGSAAAAAAGGGVCGGGGGGGGGDLSALRAPAAPAVHRHEARCRLPGANRRHHRRELIFEVEAVCGVSYSCVDLFLRSFVRSVVRSLACSFIDQKRLPAWNM